MSNIEYKVWECIVCGVIYNEKLGWPEEGLAPGTRWDDVPEDWLCPDCGVGKDDFEMVEISLQQPSGMPGSTPLPVSNDIADEKPANLAAMATSDAPQAMSAGEVYRQWECVVCGIVYDESLGWPDDGIAPGTRWEDVPEDWLCPDCGVGKSDFEMLEVGQTLAVAASKPTPTPAVAPVCEPAPAIQVTSKVDGSLKPIVIVGTGLAGYNLVRELRKQDQVTPIVMVTADNGDFYSKPQLSTGFAKSKSAAELVTGSAEKMARDLDVRIHIFSRVTAIDVDRHEIEFAGRKLRYDKLVLASGAECIQAPLQGNAASQVYQINDLADYARFRTAAMGCQKVLVIGAGLIGSEYANDLLQAGLQVDVVDPMSTPLASLLPAEAGEILQSELARAGANFHMGTVVETLESNGQGVTATLKNGTQIEADLVLSAIGVRARLELAELAGVETERGILVDRTLKTSAEDVYALGDCAQVEQHLLYYIAPLMAGARALAKTLTGEETQVRYGVMPVTVKTTLCPVTVSPPPRNAEGEWEIQRLDDASVKAEFFTPQGELLGFALTGKTAVSHKDSLISSVPDVMA